MLQRAQRHGFGGGVDEPMLPAINLGCGGACKSRLWGGPGVT